MSTHFHQFSFQPLVENVIKQLAFSEPTAIQAKVMPAVLQGTSVIGQSQTGSGKTHAYLLPLLNQLNTERQDVQFVVVAPTQELATQIYEEIRTIIHYADKEGEWIARLLVAETNKQRMLEKLAKPPHIIVGTPGRMLDFVKSGAISIYTASTFVIDEADLILDLGLIQDVDQLLIRTKENIQLLAFSATIPDQLEHFYRKYLENPLRVKTEDTLTPAHIQHRLIAVKHRSAADIIYNISRAIQPFLALIFTNGKDDAETLATSLKQKGLTTGIIHGGLSPKERKRMFKDMQNLRFQYIVATDLASRGIDIKGVSHIINAQMPKEVDFYVHRAGRTARAGMEGTVISLYEDKDEPLIDNLQQKGVTFTFWDIKNGEWKQEKSRHKQGHRQTTADQMDAEAWKQVKKPKKVKPGYKKKMKKQQERIKAQMKQKNQKSNKRK